MSGCLHGEFQLWVLHAWCVLTVGATCMVCLSCEWLYAWDASVVVVCMHGVFEL